MEEATGQRREMQAMDAMECMTVQQKEVTGRIVVQQCLHAALKLRAAEGEPPEIVEVIMFFFVVLCSTYNFTYLFNCIDTH